MDPIIYLSIIIGSYNSSIIIILLFYPYLLVYIFIYRLAIVGLTDQFLHARIDENTYQKELQFFKEEVRARSDTVVSETGFDDKITYEQE